MKVDRNRFLELKEAVDLLALEVESNHARYLLRLASTLIVDALENEELEGRS
ncbi:hypothetical protein [Thermococcus thioreducens]|uniref:Uncharacterized protein n=1 Tax=Thermococcus thioreducens TaxID=277988 RepID=A0A1I0QAL1_9EURY|nr:hypothetical protein [Thermococcus thioreducens]SEW23611.1 hypothetical protein SAMN05216170_2319 [Thermococcus thioreducens]